MHQMWPTTLSISTPDHVNDESFRVVRHYPEYDESCALSIPRDVEMKWDADRYNANNSPLQRGRESREEEDEEKRKKRRRKDEKEKDEKSPWSSNEAIPSLGATTKLEEQQQSRRSSIKAGPRGGAAMSKEKQQRRTKSVTSRTVTDYDGLQL